MAWPCFYFSGLKVTPSQHPARRNPFDCVLHSVLEICSTSFSLLRTWQTTPLLVAPPKGIRGQNWLCNYMILGCSSRSGEGIRTCFKHTCFFQSNLMLNHSHQGFTSFPSFKVIPQEILRRRLHGWEALKS